MADARNERVGHDAPRPREDAHVGAEPMPFDPGEAVDALREWTKDNPHMAIAGAAAVGFLLGGGLTPRMLGAIGMIAARHYLKQAAAEVLDKVVPEEIAEIMAKARQ